jgi:hypothetical protein
MYTLQGKPNQHDTYASCGRSPYVATVHKSSTDLNRSTSLEKEGSRHNPQHIGWLIHGSVPSFSPTIASEAVEKSQASVDDKLLSILGPYHQHVIGTFNTCSRGPTHRSLISTGGGYNLGGTSFSHATPWHSQLAVSSFHLRALPDLRLSISCVRASTRLLL